MTQELLLLSGTAATIGFVHTILGPDHYLPFIAMSKAGNWSYSKTALITFVCGIGHVAGSILLGAVGIGLGIGIARIEFFEGFRGSIAGWSLLVFGLVYFVYGLRYAKRRRPHAHSHVHAGTGVHGHMHVHTREHAHVHIQKSKKALTPWVLFVIFVFGPCEALIPVLMYPAMKHSTSHVVIVTLIFALVTIATMMAVVMLSAFGIRKIDLKRQERWMHAFAGGVVFLSGFAIEILGL